MNRFSNTFLTLAKRTASVNVIANRSICLTSLVKAKKDVKEPDTDEGVMRRGLIGVNQNIIGSLRRPKKREKSERDNRQVPVPWETSVRYMESETYKKNYGDYKVWELYRRQTKGQPGRPPFNTRVYCVGEDGYIKYATPCPVCRDRFLILHYNNVKLITQFISPHTGQVIEPRKTNLCQKKYEELLVAVYLAKDYGTISFHVPSIEYDYSLYYPEEDIKDLNLKSLDEKESIALQEEEDEVMRRIKSIEEYGYWHKHSYISNP